MIDFRRRELALLGAASLLTSTAVWAQGYPSQPIQVIVPFPAGSISDVVARIVSEKLSPRLGQPVVVQNRPGAGATIGSGEAARAKADGHTLLFSGNSTLAINPSLFRKLPYDPKKDFLPLTMAGEIPTVLIARKELPGNSLAELLKAVKAKPGSISIAYGSATAQVAIDVLNKEAGARFTAVPYKGEPLGMADILGGHVDMMILNLPVAYQAIREGKVKAIALPGNRRVEALPDVPLASETVPSYSLPNGWLAFWAPAGTPPAIAERLHKEIVDILALPDVKQRILATGGYVLYTTTPQQLHERTERDAAKWAAMIKGAGIELQ